MKITVGPYPPNGVYNTMLCYQHKLKVLVLLPERKFDEWPFQRSSLAKTVAQSLEVPKLMNQNKKKKKRRFARRWGDE